MFYIVPELNGDLRKKQFFECIFRRVAALFFGTTFPFLFLISLLVLQISETISPFVSVGAVTFGVSCLPDSSLHSVITAQDNAAPAASPPPKINHKKFPAEIFRKDLRQNNSARTNQFFLNTALIFMGFLYKKNVNCKSKCTI